MGRPEFLDIALVYALINFIAMIGVLRFFEYKQVDVVEKSADSKAATTKESEENS